MPAPSASLSLPAQAPRPRQVSGPRRSISLPALDSGRFADDPNLALNRAIAQRAMARGGRSGFSRSSRAFAKRSAAAMAAMEDTQGFVPKRTSCMLLGGGYDLFDLTVRPL